MGRTDNRRGPIRRLGRLLFIAVAVLVGLFVILVAVAKRLSPTVTPAVLEPVEIPIGTPTPDGDAVYASDNPLQGSAGSTGSIDDSSGQTQAPVSASGQTSEGTATYASDSSGNFEIWQLKAETGDTVRLTNDPNYDSWWPRLSPDRRTILFYRTPAGVHEDYAQTSMWMMGSDGTNPVEVLPQAAFGWAMQGHAEWSPDGKRLVMFGGTRVNPQIWITDSHGRNPVQITDDPGTNIDPSWSPDGATIVYVGCPNRVCFGGDQEIYSIAVDGPGDRVRLTDDDIRDHDPYFSPSGDRIAFLSQLEGAGLRTPAGVWDTRIINADGSGEPQLLVGDDNVTSMPVWLSDTEIGTHRFVYGSGQGFDLVIVDVETGEITEVLDTLGNEEYPDW